MLFLSIFIIKKYYEVTMFTHFYYKKLCIIFIFADFLYEIGLSVLFGLYFWNHLDIKYIKLVSSFNFLPEVVFELFERKLFLRFYYLLMVKFKLIKGICFGISRSKKHKMIHLYKIRNKRKFHRF